ncbi:hypothetical protein [Actinomadura sp. HBU206391]|uniref:hypothetical protein n=1 Tax=Actinomadura sp. HBU206391 TaxID=2731692 RepID=UPI00164FB38A|nr:hypothetical protein [Actinomadura sp. HBU206391]MBC6458434.1 hypothetical protein [Actinomadura sp. HBU206391]
MSSEESDLVLEHVNQAPAGPTESDETKVLEGLGYALNPATGVYEGGDPDGDE